jgi:8-oxo-dGTP pyrophosphatase MutT (NUDIX family)
MATKVMTLTHFYNPKQVLLAQKKRDFGKGLWNGYGGKVQEGETIEQAALREIQEEAGIVPDKIAAAGKITITFEHKPGDAIEIHLFRCAPFYGEAAESEEMLPRWFGYNEIPYEAMWPNDPLWVRDFLSGKNIEGDFHLDKEMKKVLRHSVRAWV